MAGTFVVAQGGGPTAVINQTMARRYFPDRSPLGLIIQNPHGKSEVVGVVADVHNQGLDKEPRKQVYLPLKQSPTAGMAVCPCSMGTVAAIAHGVSENLIHRAADVHLKERRKLVLVPRETPLGLVQLRNLAAAAEAGAVVLPAMPAFYTRPQSVADLVDFVAGRVCDQLGVGHALFRRWGAESGDGGAT